MANNNLQIELQSRVISLFLKLVKAPIRQLLNQCQLFIGLKAGESVLILECTSVLEADILQEQAWYLASAADLLGIRRVLISHRGELFYFFSVELILRFPEYEE